MSSSEALKLKELGNKAFEKKDFKMALDFYEKAIFLVPTEMTFILNSAAAHFQLKNFEKCVQTCLKAVKIGRENGADSKLIAKSFARMGRTHKELGNLEMAKLAFEKAQEEHQTLDYEKSLSEIESAMKNCQMEENVENLYKVVKIDGKGLGCVALKDIEIGTLILKEKPQCVGDILEPLPPNLPEFWIRKNLPFDDTWWNSVIRSFEQMKKSDQDEYLKLHNAFNGQGLSDVIGIYKTNAMDRGVGIKISRFNHSCCPNSAASWNAEDGTGEIRAWSKILAGEEITINYYPSMVKARAFRQNILSSDCYFKCNCELCQKEAISNDDDERYEKFEKLRKETKRLHNENNQHVANLPIWEMVDIQSIFPGTTFTNSMIKESIYQNLIDNTKKAITCFKEMYELAQNPKEPSRFMPYYHEIIILVIGVGFNMALFGCMIFTQRGLDLCFQPDVSSLEYFKDECQKFSKIGLEMSENMCGSDSVLTKKWKERNDLERWMAQDEKLWFNFY